MNEDLTKERLDSGEVRERELRPRYIEPSDWDYRCHLILDECTNGQMDILCLEWLGQVYWIVPFKSFIYHIFKNIFI